MKIGLFYGSDTGNTEEVVNSLIELLGAENIDEHYVSDASAETFAEYERIVIGIPTWYDGELQSDWETAYDNYFQEIDFTGKTVAIFGLGDQHGYGDWFIDGVGILADVVMENGGQLIGLWDAEGYEYAASKAEIELEGHTYFKGLAIDVDNEPELTDERLQIWTEQILEEFES
ncbi:flavodoxin [Aureibacter tunicatorum]|uniref:Flavodoxin n=1 Tax=Aureibacter tunicatorum TaxID=866807 RepID=A0AAE4BP57_9BACT|nr:flavodoxin [Aureibacter tunicatorum]MDR6237594.1 flavodoxin I [Aureibacter tunicatorum]BDD02628.1 flavodoxin [Aureibacter tunicatorum]